jgi:hypothetical protein
MCGGPSVMAGLVPAIRPAPVRAQMAETGPTMTDRAIPASYAITLMERCP